MITYRNGHDIDMIRLIELLNEAGYNDITTDFEELLRMVESSKSVVTAWDFDYMVGFINTLSGNNSKKSEYVLVDKEYDGTGIEKKLMSRISDF